MYATAVRRDLDKDTSETSFHARLERFSEKYRALWWRGSTGLPDLGAPITRRRQRLNRRSLDHFTDRMEGELNALPSYLSPSGPVALEAERRQWLNRLRETMRDFGNRVLPLGAAERRVIFSDDYFDATVRFVREAYAFDPGIEIADLSQALRNVWIMHLFQLLLNRRITHTPPILAYSLLYPYTDNRLDDPAQPAPGKRFFCQRLERRLAGQRLLPEDRNETAVFRLIGRIEEAFPRSAYPDVYRSLLAIHDAQTRSLCQQGKVCHDLPCDAELLRMSVAKGGASVLADGYLIAGDLSYEEADFFFGYGVFLQLADALQDAEQDRRHGHSTIFSSHLSSSGRGRPLDHLANRLVHFLDSVLASEHFSSGRHAVLRSLIRRSCVQLVVESAGQQPRCFSSRYLRTLERHSITRFSYWRKKRSSLLGLSGKIKGLLEARLLHGR